jgi:hypothetical protein
VFEEHNLRSGETYAFPIFFYRRKTPAAVTAALITAAIGASLEELVSFVGSLMASYWR